MIEGPLIRFKFVIYLLLLLLFKYFTDQFKGMRKYYVVCFLLYFLYIF